MDKNFMTERQAAEYLSVSTSFLRQSRARDAHVEGPPFVRLGRAIRYSRAAVDRWVEANAVSLASRGASTAAESE